MRRKDFSPKDPPFLLASSYLYWEELIVETSPTLLLSWLLLPLEGRMTELLLKLGAQSFHFTLFSFVCSLQQDFSEPVAQILGPSFSSQHTSAVMSYFISFPLSSAGSSRLTVWFICQSKAARCGCFCELISEWEKLKTVAPHKPPAGVFLGSPSVLLKGPSSAAYGSPDWLGSVCSCH